MILRTPFQKTNIGNNADTDDDNEGIEDEHDDFPLDADGDGIGKVNEQNRAQGLPTIEMGIGLNEAEVIVGNIG